MESWENSFSSVLTILHFDSATGRHQPLPLHPLCFPQYTEASETKTCCLQATSAFSPAAKALEKRDHNTQTNIPTNYSATRAFYTPACEALFMLCLLPVMFSPFSPNYPSSALPLLSRKPHLTLSQNS